MNDPYIRMSRGGHFIGDQLHADAVRVRLTRRIDVRQKDFVGIIEGMREIPVKDTSG